MPDTKKEYPPYPHVRVTKPARIRLDELLPAIRRERGTNVTMTDLVSEYILSQPLPQPQAIEKKRSPRKPVTKSQVAAGV